MHICTVQRITGNLQRQTQIQTNLGHRRRYRLHTRAVFQIYIELAQETQHCSA